ncbi:MAG: 5'/3'-nucleotidase SurE [Clostridia bacterium]|nr:5'/3'-nucleotidase SurE [Clostridia bacterium]
MNVLICNDDGIFSEGLLALANVLKKNHNIYIFVPDGNRSGFSRSLSFHKDIVVKKVEYNGFKEVYTVSGTPGDAVKIALTNFLTGIDIVVSGVNLGSNLGNDIFYSGTVNACFEANELGYKALALSSVAQNDYNFNGVTEFIEKYFDKLANLADKGYTLNVNVPNIDFDKIKGVKFCKSGVCRYADEYIKVAENTYQLVGNPIPPTEKDFDTDVYYVHNGYVSITPVVHKVLSEEHLEKFKNIEF